MRFLDDFQFRRKTDSNDTATTNETRSNEIQSSLTFTEDFNSTHSESEVCQVSSKTNTSYESKKRKARNIEEPTDKVLEYLIMRNEQKQTRTEDEVDHFFLSYAQSFKKLPSRMQPMLKLDMATLFARYELQAAGVSNVVMPQMTDQSLLERPLSTLSHFSTPISLPASIPPSNDTVQETSTSSHIRTNSK